jgi:DnaA family protein
MQPLDDAEKRVALQRHAETLGFRLDPQVANYLLSRSARDMQSLLAVLEALDRVSLEAQRPITLPLARQLLQA